MISVRRDEGGPVAESEALGPEQLPVAGATVDLLVRAVARQHGVQRPMALGAIEALLVPHGALGELLLGGEHHAAAARAALAGRRLDRGRVRIIVRSIGRNLVLPARGGGECGDRGARLWESGISNRRFSSVFGFERK